MSDMMLFGVLGMPFDMAMGDELSRIQFWQRAQQAVTRIQSDADRIAELEQKLKNTEYAKKMVSDRRDELERQNAELRQQLASADKTAAIVQPVADSDSNERAAAVMRMAHGYCPLDLPHLDKMRWMAKYFIENYTAPQPQAAQSDSGLDADYWYTHRRELKPEQVFRLSDDSFVKLDRSVPGDGTKWYVADWSNGWSYCDSTIEPGDLRGEPITDIAAALAQAGKEGA